MGSWPQMEPQVSCHPPLQPQPQPQPQCQFVCPQPQPQCFSPQLQGQHANVANVLAPSHHPQSWQQVTPQHQVPVYGVGASGPSNNAMAGTLVPSRQWQGAPWTTGLFDCMQDPTNALVTALFPCVTFGQIADVLDNGHTTCTTSAIMYATAHCFMGRPYRRKLRMRFGLAEYPFPDWLVHSLFPHCALCQEYRELKNRGLAPPLGHHGNLVKKQTEQNLTTTAPPKNQVMGN